MSVRQRQEVQKMLRSLILTTILVAAAHAGVWPAQIGGNALKSEQPVQITADRDLWNEYGFVSATAGDYGQFQATAYRFQDGTDAVAAGQWMAASNPVAAIAGSYVVTCQGRCPAAAQWQDVEFPNKGRDETPLVWAYLPRKGQVSHSGRYALGPMGLQRFAPQIPGAAAAFQFGTEITTAQYQTDKGEQQLILLAFPMPQIARQQLGQLQKIPGAVVKRTGPLVAVVPSPQDPTTANRLLAEINYQAQVSRDEQPPPKVTAQGVASMVLTILKLAGVLILFCLFAGLGFAGIQQLRKRLGYENAGEAMIVLHLVDR